jgi:HAD superfamily hydrolase (TIGR01459 family)
MNSLSDPPPIAVAGGLSPLLPRYGAVICDIWGVVHDGLAVFPEAADCLKRVRASGRPVVLVSNSPRRSDGVIRQLGQLGLDPDTYDAVVTSGDATRAAIAEGRFGRRYHFVGPERDRPLVEGLALTEAAAVEDADFVLATGLVDDRAETPAYYAPLLDRALARDLPLVCANPDIVVMQGDQRLWCAGALAADYHARGGKAHLFGKPHAPIYRMCRERLAVLSGGDVAPETVLAIGDGIETDIAGAGRAGMASVLIASGIHRDDLLGADGAPSVAAAARACAEAGARPVAVMSKLAW